MEHGGFMECIRNEQNIRHTHLSLAGELTEKRWW